MLANTMPDARPRAKEKSAEPENLPSKKMAALPRKGRLAYLGFSQVYNTTDRGVSSSFTPFHGVSTFGVQMPMADQLNAVGRVFASDSFSHPAPCHAVNEPQTENHTGLVVLDGADVLLQLFLLLSAP